MLFNSIYYMLCGNILPCIYDIFIHFFHLCRLPLMYIWFCVVCSLFASSSFFLIFQINIQGNSQKFFEIPFARSNTCMPSYE